MLSAKSTAEFVAKSDLIIQYIDPEIKQKECVPSKVKKYVVDKIKSIIIADPKEHGA